MAAALHIQTAILPGRRIEISSPELPESGLVDLLIYLPASDELASPYPTELMAEYRTLTRNGWQHPLSEAEQTRLETIKAAINALDTQAGREVVWRTPLEQIQIQLARIRAEAEALP